MKPEELVARIEAEGGARRLLRGAPAGVNAAFFARVLALSNHDPQRAARLTACWRAFLDLGDDPALAYRAKGFADRMAGRWLASARAFEKAAEGAKDPADRLAFATGAIDGLAKGGRLDEAVALGARLAGGLDRLGRPELAARARLNAGNALVWAERGPEARALYAKAIPAFAAAGMALEEMAARLGLSTTHLYGGDPRLAEAEATKALELARSLGLEHAADLCEVNLAHFALVQGRADEAFARLAALRPRLEGSPAELARAHEFVGDAALRLNLFAEASAAYAAALGSKALPHTDRAHVLLGLGESTRDPDEADRHLARAAARYRRVGNRPWEGAALAARVARRPAARAALRLADRALDAAQASPYHTVLALLARANALAVRGRPAPEELAKAERIARRHGYRRFAWRVHALRARAARAPLPHYRRMLDEVLRERLANTSVAARTGFLDDKAEALGAYLACLLADPTPRHVAEAREAVRRTRAVTLLDEIVSGAVGLDPVRARRLEELRAQVAQDAADEPAPDARAALQAAPERRAWTEATHVLGALDAALSPPVAPGAVVFVEAHGALWAIVGERAVRLGMDADDLTETLDWLAFELAVPTAHRDASPKEALRLLERLRKTLVEPWSRAEGGGRRAEPTGEATAISSALIPPPSALSPDGPLWRVPWDALLGRTVPLTLHPSLAGGGAVGPLERIAVWIDTPPDLPNAPSEERTLLARFPQATVLRTRAEVLDSLGEPWDLVHVVGHARHNAENPMFSALAFPDGPLYASEIARSPLRTRLACLSACETGALSSAVRAEPDGLARAFLARGALGVLASLWPLDDEAASRFFAALYNDLSPADDLAQAVDRARDSVREWREHPYFWAALALFGGYRP